MLFLRALPGDRMIQPLRGWVYFPTSNCILFRSSGLSVFRTFHSTPDFSVPPGLHPGSLLFNPFGVGDTTNLKMYFFSTSDS